jgi:integral membrane sensor domain MASE1
MQLLYNIGALVSVAVTAVGLFLLHRLGLFGNDLSTCILALVIGPSMGLLLNMLRLRDRIDALEKQKSQDK